MTYKDLIESIKEYSLLNPDVNNFIYGDITYLNKPNVLYPCIVLTPLTHNSLDAYTNQYNFTMVYVERLTDDRKKVDFHSVGISILKDICNRIEGESKKINPSDYYSVTIGNIDVYTQPKNADYLSGAYINFSVEMFDEIAECYYKEDGSCS